MTNLKNWLGALLLAMITWNAHATIVGVDMLTDAQSAFSAGPVGSSTLQQSLGQLPGAASFIDTRTLIADQTGGPGLVIASVGGGSYSCDRSVLTFGVCDLVYVTDEPISVMGVSLDVATDPTGVGNSTLALYINGAVAPVWSHTMMSLSESLLIPFGLASFPAGTTFDLRSTGLGAADFSAYNLFIDVPERVPEPASMALVVIAFGGMTMMRRRRMAVASAA